MGVRSQIVAGALGVGAGALPIPGGIEGIPQRALQAYVNAAASPEACPGMRWSVLAAIYRKESGHGTHGSATINDDGVVSPPIYGPPVDWMGGARAEGPGQFMPSSWDLFGHGGDPQDIDDATMATVRHLCGTYGDLEGAHLRGAIVSYYGADQDGYADDVLADVAAYDRAAPYLVEQPTSKERTPQRVGSKLWNVTLRGWIRAGEAAEVVRLGWLWDNADDAMFGPDNTAAGGPLPTRPDQLDPTFGAKLDALLAAAPGVTVRSGFRDPQAQKDLWDDYQAGVGNPAFWSDGTTCESKHCEGLAVDLTFPDAETEAWVHLNAARFGLTFPFDHEPWHVELAG